MALFGGLFKLLAAGEAVEGVTGAKTLLGKTMGHITQHAIVRPIVQGLGGNPAQEIRNLAANLKSFKAAITHPIQELNRRYDFFNLSVQDFIRVPTLEEQEFRVDAINQNDPIRSINKIHASIIQNLNVVNKNTIALFGYTRKAVSAQDDKIDEITKIQDKNQKTHDDLERRYTRLSSQIRDFESSRGGGMGMFGDEDEDRSDKYKEDSEHEGIWNKIKDLLVEMGEGALGLYALKKAGNLMRGRRGSGGKIRTRTGALGERAIEREAAEKAARRGGRGTGLAGEEIGKEAGRLVRRPGFMSRVLRSAGRGGAIGGALEAATELKQLEQRDTEHTFRSRARRFFGIPENEEERKAPAPWNQSKTGEELSNIYSLKKQNILMESMTDIKFNAISNIDVRARRINLKASDQIVFDSPRIIFTSHPIIRQYEKGGGPGRGKPVTTLKTRALSPEEVSQQELPSELYSPTLMTPGGGIGGFSGGGGGGPSSPYYGGPSQGGGGRRGGGGGGGPRRSGGADQPMRGATTNERFEKAAETGSAAVPYTSPRTETAPPDVEKALANLPSAIRETARGYIQNLTPEEREAVTSGRKSIRDLVQEKGGSGAREFVESQYHKELDRFQREITTPTTRSVPAYPAPRMGDVSQLPTWQKGQKIPGTDFDVPKMGAGNAGGAGAGLVSPVTGTFSGGGDSHYGASRSGGGRAHSGIDWQAQDGSDVKSVTGGKVLYRGNNQGYDENIVIQHDDGVVRRYAAHGSVINAAPGTRVERGQVIGQIGRGHLHYEEIPSEINGRPNPKYNEFINSPGQFVGTSNQVGTRDPSQSLGLGRGTEVTGGVSLGGGGGTRGGLRYSGNDLDRASFDNMFKGTKMEGQYDKVVAEARKNNISPSLMAGVIAHETGRGTSDAIRNQNNPAGLMEGPRSETKSTFPTVESGLEEAGRRISRNLKNGGDTIVGLGGVYAPTTGATNDPDNKNKDWIPGVQKFKEQLQGQGEEPEPQPVPMYSSENLPKGFPGTSSISEEEISRNVPPTKITPEKKEKEFTSSLAIKDMTKEAGFGTQFGKMDKVEGMVIHHTGPISSVEGVIATFKERNFPAHYIIDRQGNVIRTIPEGYQGQHVEPTDKENRNYVAKGAPPGKSNANLKGVEIMAKNDADTLPVQRAAAAKLVGEDARKEGYDPKTSTWGHGELNPGHKEADEGMSTVSRIRSGELSTEASSSGTVIKGEIVGQHAPGGKDTGSITLPGTKPGEESRTFSFISGGGGRGAAPETEYEIGETMQGGILGQRQVLTEKGQSHDTARDPAYPGAPRSELRFHKDISQGDHTDGCIGILGDHKVYADFQRRLLYVMEKDGPGKTTFRLGSKEAQEVMERMDAKPDKEPPIKDSQVQSASEQALKYSNLPGTKGWTFEPKEGTERPSVAGARDADTEEQQLTEWQMRGGDFGARAREQRGVFKMPEGAIPPMETITPKQGITPTPDESAKPISLREWFGFKSPKNPDEVSPERLREYGWGQHERPGLPEQAPPEYDYSYGNVRRYGVGRNQILAPPSGRKIEEDIRDAEDIEKDQQEENVKKDDKEEKAKQDERRDSEKPASKEVEKVKSPRHDPEAESKGANDDGYGSQHRNSGDYTGTTDHDPDLDS